LVGKLAHFQFSGEGFAYSFGGADHKLPWGHIHRAQLEPLALLLFVTRYAAIIVPVATAPAEAIEFAVAKVGSNA
jgi:hypothetical protein